MLFADQLQQLNWRIILDILVVSVLCYQVMNVLKGTRAAQVLIGITIIFIAYAMSGYLELNTLNWIISKFYSSIIVVVIVLFQDDLRRLLTRVGRGPFIQGMDEDIGVRAIDEAINAARTLSHERAGAIIVFERGIGLDRLYDHSVKLDCIVSEQILLSIFQSFSPLHDGAVIIQKGRLSCASAQLPLSKNPSFSKKMGTRHSAAVGISEETDAVVLVVSEETGNISVAWDGQLQRQPNADITRRLMMNLLIPQTREQASGVRRFVQAIKNWSWEFFSGSSSRKQKTEFGGNQRRTAWGEKKNGTSAETRSAPQRQMTTTGTVVSTDGDAQRWSMNLRLPRHPGTRKRAIEPQNAEVVTEVEASADLHSRSLESDFDEEQVIKNDHRFVPPMPPEPPPRDVTVGGVSLNPPLDTTDGAHSGSGSKDSHADEAEGSEKDKKEKS